MSAWFKHNTIAELEEILLEIGKPVQIIFRISSEPIYAVRIFKDERTTGNYCWEGYGDTIEAAVVSALARYFED